jgi:peptidoglycan/xylan/chitin deacetylase (PgdA/CDA1 family)
MTSDEARALVRSGLVAIGAHSVTHPSMATQDAAACEREITMSKRTCEDLAGAPITAFCYPYAEFNPQARTAVKAAGFISACAKGRACAPTSDVFALPRLYVPNLSGDEFEQRLRWASNAG